MVESLLNSFILFPYCSFIPAESIDNLLDAYGSDYNKYTVLFQKLLKEQGYSIEDLARSISCEVENRGFKGSKIDKQI